MGKETIGGVDIEYSASLKGNGFDSVEVTARFADGEEMRGRIAYAYPRDESEASWEVSMNGETTAYDLVGDAIAGLKAKIEKSARRRACLKESIHTIMDAFNEQRS